jgi:hypothetical protein
MIEAQIICSAPCDIPDLGIFGLKRGEERWVSDSTANRSQDLVKERNKGNVRVYRKSRRIDAPPRRPPPPFVARSRPSGERPTAPPPTPERVEDPIVERMVETSTPMDTDALARQVKAEILADLLPGIRVVVQEEMGINAGQLESVLEGVLRRVMPAGDTGGGPRREPARRPQAPEEPLFFPTALVDKDAKSRISVKTETGGESESLDDAQEMLREMKRRRGDGKTDEEK